MSNRLVQVSNVEVREQHCNTVRIVVTLELELSPLGKMSLRFATLRCPGRSTHFPQVAGCHILTEPILSGMQR